MIARKVLSVIALTSLYSAVHGQQTLFINEIVADNQAGQMDDFFQHDDWIEIYNAGSLINLAGYYLSDDETDLTKWRIPATNPGVTYILPGDHLILWVDRDPEQGEDHVDFSLNIDGETVFLVAPNGTTIIDNVTFPQLASDISWGRSCDGCENWQYFNNVTFDAPNQEITPSPQLLFINELQTLNTSTIKDLSMDYDPWLEIYNPNSFQVNLAGYYLGTAQSPQLWQVPADNPLQTVIPANGFRLIWCDNEPGEGTLHAPALLNPSGGTIRLTAPNGTTVTDNYTYPAGISDKSFGRQSDGSVSSVVFDRPTPRVTNTLIFIEPALLFINEVQTSNLTDVTDNYDEHEDWFEIYNPNDFPVSLVGYSLTDNPENPVKWIIPNSFPDSVTIPAKGWILFWADEDQDQGVLHTSFRLSNTGEYLGLFSPDGFSLVDEIRWNMMESDVSLGRLTDGNESWVSFLETTPDASNNGATVTVGNIDASSGLILVYPNPTASRLHLSERGDVEVYTIDGRLIQRETSVIHIATDQWQSGCYLIRTSDGNVHRVIRN